MGEFAGVAPAAVTLAEKSGTATAGKSALGSIAAYKQDRHAWPNHCTLNRSCKPDSIV